MHNPKPSLRDSSCRVALHVAHFSTVLLKSKPASSLPLTRQYSFTDLLIFIPNFLHFISTSRQNLSALNMNLIKAHLFLKTFCRFSLDLEYYANSLCKALCDLALSAFHTLYLTSLLTALQLFLSLYFLNFFFFFS